MEVIGKGSYGVVRLGFRNGTAFAVKSANKNCTVALQALENEIEILRCLALSKPSPFIVEYYGDDETGLGRNLYMEYLPGGDLARVGKVVDISIVSAYTYCLVKALSELHSRKIVHCDVKGSNVLIGPGNGIAKLADFGSAKHVVDDEVHGLVPRGSPLWMAPEVIRGESQLYESDVWSLGCTVIEIFTGKPAWQDRGAHTLYQIGYSDDLPEYPAQLPDVARDFLDKCLVRDPGQRWSCDQLLQHPFLLSTLVRKNGVDYSTPRSILDWDNLDFSDDDECQPQYSDKFEEFGNTTIDLAETTSAKDRVRDLETSAGINWESDGWIEVRTMKKDDEEEYSDLYEGDVGTTTTSERVVLEIEDMSTWNNLFTEINDDVEGDGEDGFGYGGGLRCRQEGQEVESCGQVRREKNITAVTTSTRKELSLFMFLLIIIMYNYSTSFGPSNVNNKDYSFINTKYNVSRSYAIYIRFLLWCFGYSDIGLVN